MLRIAPSLTESLLEFYSQKLTKSKTNTTISARDIAQADAFPVTSFNQLRTIIAKLSYLNKNYILFYRGQNHDYKTQNNCSSFLPTIYRGKRISKNELKFRWEKLNIASNLLHIKFNKINKNKKDISIRKKLVQWSILQHYEVTGTPLIDVTQSLRVACSFAMKDIKDNQKAFIYVFALPYYTNRISINSEEELLNIRLLSIAPPQALRPYYQEGFLVGEDEITENIYRKTSLDLNNRLVAKFEIAADPKSFWGNNYSALSEEELYPQKYIEDNGEERRDEILEICNEIKDELYEHFPIIGNSEFKEFMKEFEQIKEILYQKSKHPYNRNYTLSKIIDSLNDQGLKKNLRKIQKDFISYAYKREIPQKATPLNTIKHIREQLINLP